MNASAGFPRIVDSDGESSDLLQWMQKLAAGTWSADDFLREITRPQEAGISLCTNALALLDQHFEHDLISHVVYISVRSRLQKHLEEGSGAAPSGKSVLHAGDVVRGRYRIAEVLERSETGTLIEAVDEHRMDVPSVGKRVALYVFDVLRPQESELLQRAYCMQSLSHPCVQRVFDVDEYQGQLFVSLEWVSGVTISQLLELNAGKGLASEVALKILSAVASALACTHAQRICHGRLSAGSVVISDGGDIKLRSFDLGAVQGEVDAAADRLCFARLAHEVLVGRTNADPRLPGRRPPGLSPVQWQWLRDTLLGKDSGGLLDAFAGESSVAGGRYRVTQAIPAAPPSRRMRRFLLPGLGMAAIIALGIGAFLTLRGASDAANKKSAATTPVEATLIPAAAPGFSIAPTVTDEAPEPAFEPVGETAQVAVHGAAQVPRRKTRIELTASFVQPQAGESLARVRVRRQGNLDRPVSFFWWTEAGSAQGARDFMAVERRLEKIAAGSTYRDLEISLVPGLPLGEQRVFYVKIEAADTSGADLGTRTLTEVSIPAAKPVQPTAAF